MSVLIGIATRNRCNLLRKALDSANSQQYLSRRIAVFDDNSTDNTNSLKVDFPGVSWISSTETKGYLYARNSLMRNAYALYYCSLDDDSWFISPDAIEKAVNFFEEHCNVAAIAFDVQSSLSSTTASELSPFEVGAFLGCGHILRLKAVQEVGYYDPFPCLYGGEEKELCMKLINNGYRVMLMPGVQVWHELTQIARESKDQYQSNVCNDLVLMYRRCPSLLVIPVVLFKIFKHLKHSIFTKRLYFSQAIKGIYIFLQHLMIGNLKRAPVRLDVFIKFYRLAKIFMAYHIGKR